MKTTCEGIYDIRVQYVKESNCYKISAMYESKEVCNVPLDDYIGSCSLYMTINDSWSFIEHYPKYKGPTNHSVEAYAHYILFMIQNELDKNDIKDRQIKVAVQRCNKSGDLIGNKCILEE